MEGNNSLEDFVNSHGEVAKSISRTINEGDYTSALFMLDNLPDFTVKTDAFYGAIALSITREMEEKEYKGETAKLAQDVIKYCAGKCDYFG